MKAQHLNSSRDCIGPTLTAPRCFLEPSLQAVIVLTRDAGTFTQFNFTEFLISVAILETSKTTYETSNNTERVRGSNYSETPKAQNALFCLIQDNEALDADINNDI